MRTRRLVQLPRSLVMLTAAGLLACSADRATGGDGGSDLGMADLAGLDRPTGDRVGPDLPADRPAVTDRQGDVNDQAVGDRLDVADASDTPVPGDVGDAGDGVDAADGQAGDPVGPDQGIDLGISQFPPTRPVAPSTPPLSGFFKGTAPLGRTAVGFEGGGGLGGPPAGCSTCREVIDRLDPINETVGTLCGNNGPPTSSTLYNDLRTCVCNDPTCVSACRGVPDSCTDPVTTMSITTNQACFNCCNAQFLACHGDVRTPAPGCLGCANYLADGQTSGTGLCASDTGPSSRSVWNTAWQCGCQNGPCTSVCTSVCNGQPATAACLSCYQTNCGSALSMCLGDPSSSSDPGCASCAQAFSGNAAGQPLCRPSSPGVGTDSAQLFGAVTQCLCVGTCATDCAGFCQGTAPASQACQTCAGLSCLSQSTQCLTDEGACTHCAQYFQGSGDASRLCQSNAPSSASLAQAVYDCTCTDACATDCADLCFDAQCRSAAQACLADTP
jgi:hypothetical protein